MEKHQPTGNGLLGIILTLTTVLMWGGLALTLKIVGEQMSPLTICWYRFFIAFLLTLLFLKFRYGTNFWHLLKKLKGHYLLFCLSFLGLAFNYIFYVLSVGEISPASTQVLLQLGPIFFTIGAVLIYREPFILQQKIGFLIVVIGFLGFFYNKIIDLVGNFDVYFWGIIFGVVSSLTWSIYALSQKQLLTKYKSFELLLLIFAFCSILLLPFSSPKEIFELSNIHLALLIFACLNTVIAYFCLTEAVNVWEASKVSGGIALTPIVSIIIVELAASWFPNFSKTESLTLIGYTGAGMVVCGSMMMTIVMSRKKIN